jgi:O-acetyl-ADP-ribose deacetylase (regulator of RNase III)
MATIIKKNTDIFTLDVDVLVNPVNTRGVMGAGLALQFKQRYPLNYAAYREKCLAKDFKVGKMFLFEEKGKIIANVATKEHWKDNSHIINVAGCVLELFLYLRKDPTKSIAIPALGCGLGGLKWENVSEIIFTFTKRLPNDCYVLEP